MLKGMSWANTIGAFILVAAVIFLDGHPPHADLPEPYYTVSQDTIASVKAARDIESLRRALLLRLEQETRAKRDQTSYCNNRLAGQNHLTVALASLAAMLLSFNAIALRRLARAK
jgi:hypothetical protein